MEIKLEDKDIRSILAKEFNCDVDDIIFSSSSIPDEDSYYNREITQVSAVINKEY